MRFSPPGVFSPLLHKSHVTYWPLSIFLCVVTPVCYKEGVARKTAYRRPQSVCYLLRECGGGRGGGWSRKRGGAGGTLVLGPGPGAPNNLHTLTTPSCRDLRTPCTQIYHFTMYILFQRIQRKKKEFNNVNLSKSQIQVKISEGIDKRIWGLYKITCCKEWVRGNSMWPTFSQNAIWSASDEWREEIFTHGPSFHEIFKKVFPLFILYGWQCVHGWDGKWSVSGKRKEMELWRIARLWPFTKLRQQSQMLRECILCICICMHRHKFENWILILIFVYDIGVIFYIHLKVFIIRKFNV